MSIASEISRLQTAKADLKTSIENKGVTVPASAKLDAYSDYVDSIQTGVTPTGTRNINTNGTFDVTNYATANVAVPASAVDSGTKSISTNGTHDVIGYASVNVSVSGDTPNIQSLSVTTNGTYTASGGIDGYSPVVVNVSGGGGGSGNIGDPVRFFDYDGNVVYSYSVEDFAALTAMPSNPTHTGLTSQGWNWSLADAKSYVATCKGLDIGQMYITDDGKTRVYITLSDSVRLSPYLGICPNGTVRVDWGDGSNKATFSGNSLTTVIRAQHTYASAGDYVITLEVTDGSFAIYGSNTSTNGSYLLTRTNTDTSSQRCYQSAIQKVELGANVSIGNYAFSHCYSLKSITIPNSNSISQIAQSAFRECYSLFGVILPPSVTSVGSSPFDTCRSLKTVLYPNTVTSLGTQAFYNIYSLCSIKIPSGVTSMGGNGFGNCYSLRSITVPPNVSQIYGNAFGNCNGVAEYHILPTTPPSLASTTAFSGILDDCKIYVPSASLTAYQEATNWSTYASYMVGE